MVFMSWRSVVCSSDLYSIDAGEAAFFDPAVYEFDKIERSTLSLSKDREWSGRVDVTRSFALDTGTFDIQAGGKARLRKKTFEYTQDKYDGVDGELTLADVLGRQSYSLADKIGRASCRERVCRYVEISVVAVSLKKKKSE